MQIVVKKKLAIKYVTIRLSFPKIKISLLFIFHCPAANTSNEVELSYKNQISFDI